MTWNGPGAAHVASPPRSIAELAATSDGWKVESGDFGRWITAEYLVQRDGRWWRIGLTPVTGEVTAMVLWHGEVVMDHARGAEADMCARAHHTLMSIIEGHAVYAGPGQSGRGRAQDRNPFAHEASTTDDARPTG